MTGSKRLLVSALVGILLLTLFVGLKEVNADFAALTLYPAKNNPYVYFGGVGSTVGWEFIANTNCSITKLGYFSYNGNLIASHDVGIYSANGSLLAHTTVTSSSPLSSDSFRYNTLPTPLVLSAGSEYILAGVNSPPSPGDMFYYNSCVTMEADITYLSGTGFLVSTSSNGQLVFPNQNIINYSLISGNFQLELPVQSPTPIPGAVWLFGSGLVGLIGLKRKYLG